MKNIFVIVPCYNEGTRLDTDAFQQFQTQPNGVRFLFVNDGSSDNTSEVLQRLCATDPERFALKELSKNHGKAEAVRQGMLAAFDRHAEYLGMWDADLATPLKEIPRFLRVLDRYPEVLIVTGARVQLLGRDIRRRSTRHYLGRLAASLISYALELPIYDTQCGAKFLRLTDETRSLFTEPFLSSWIFDVELIARAIRLHRAGRLPPLNECLRELPLYQWTDKEGSKIRPLDYIRALGELWQIREQYLVKRSDTD